MIRNARFTIIIAVFFLAVFPTLGRAADNGMAAATAFSKFFIAGGPLVWFALLPLSLINLALIITYFLSFRRSRILPESILHLSYRLLEEKAYDHFAALEENNSSLLAVTLAAVGKERLQGRMVMEKNVEEHLEQFTATMLRRIEWLNIIGNVAPMIGLFGTVWGMIDAFNGIVQAGGQPEPAELAGGISVALVTTWWGLIIAIPALAAFGSLRNRIHTFAADAAVILEEVIDNLELKP